MTSSSPSFLNQFLKADSQLLVVKFPLLEAPDEANFVEHRGTALLVKARDLLTRIPARDRYRSRAEEAEELSLIDDLPPQL